LGYSLGSVPSCHLASQKSAHGLVLCAPVASGTRLALPISCPGDCFHNIRRIKKVTMPLLIFHGDADRIVPLSNGRALFRNAASSNKTFILCQNAGHNDLFAMLGDDLWDSLKDL